MPDKERIDVFISSTSYDLPDHRRAVIKALNLLKLQPIGMEYWAVTGDDPVAVCECTATVVSPMRPSYNRISTMHFWGMMNAQHTSR